MNVISFCQQKLEMSLGVSNMEQIENPISNFYRVDYTNGFNTDLYINENKSTVLKYNVNFTVQLKDSLNLRFRFGYGQNNKLRVMDYPNALTKINENQSFVEFCPSIGKSKTFGLFTLNTGLEIPIYMASAYKSLTASELRDSTLQVTGTQESEQKIDGGFLIGLNNFIHLQLKISKNMSLFSELNVGLMYARLGGNYYQKITLSGINPLYSSLKKEYTKFFFTAPQIQFGITFNFLK